MTACLHRSRGVGHWAEPSLKLPETYNALVSQKGLENEHGNLKPLSASLGQRHCSSSRLSIGSAYLESISRATKTTFRQATKQSQALENRSTLKANCCTTRYRGFGQPQASAARHHHTLGKPSFSKPSPPFESKGKPSQRSPAGITPQEAPMPYQNQPPTHIRGFFGPKL